MLTKSLILAIMWTESGFNPEALSEKGAMGLMQIMPTTWSGLERVYKLPTSSHYTDPTHNILYSILLLAELSETARNERELLAMYNGGFRQLENMRTGLPLAEETESYIDLVLHRRSLVNQAKRQGGNPFPAYAGIIDQVLDELREGGRWSDTLPCVPGVFGYTRDQRKRPVCRLLYPEPQTFKSRIPTSVSNGGWDMGTRSRVSTGLSGEVPAA